MNPNLKTLILILFLFSNCKTVNINTYKVNRYDKNNLKHGVWVENFIDSSIRISNYSHNVLNGLERVIFKNQSHKVTNYKNGKRNGYQFIYDSKSWLARRYLYKNDSLVEMSINTPPF